MDKLRIRSLSSKKNDKRVKKVREFFQKSNNFVWNINYDFLDYIILFNENEIKDEEIYLDICKKYNTTILVSKKREGKQYCAVIETPDVDLYMEIPENGIINDDILCLDDNNDWILHHALGAYHIIRTASIADKPNVNGYIYSKEEFTKAINADFIQMRLKSGMFGVECKSSIDRKDLKELYSSNPINYVGYIHAIGNKSVIVKGNYNWMCINNGAEMDRELLAYMVYTGDVNHDTRKIKDFKILNYDIYLNTHVTKEYLVNTLKLHPTIGATYSTGETRIV